MTHRPSIQFTFLPKLVASSLILATMLCQPIQASNLPDIFAMSLEDLLQIEVESAAKHPEKVSEIPASIYIITRKDIELAGYQTLTEILRSVPGVYHLDTYDNDLLGIRGMVDTGFGDIVMLVNGMVQPANLLKYITIPPEAIDKIEFIRGPMSVIYGNGAFLGSINIVTNDSYSEDNQIMTALSKGGLNSSRAGVRWSTSNADGKMSTQLYRASSEGIDASYQDMMDESHLASIPEGAHLTTQKDLQQENWGVMLSGNWKDFYAQYFHQHVEREAWVLTPSFAEGNREKVNITATEIGFRRELSDTLKLDSKLSYTNFDAQRDFDAITPDFEGDRNTGSQRFELELNLYHQPSSQLDFLWGANYLLTKNNDYYISIPLFDYDETVEDGEIKTASIFFQSNYKYSEQWSFIIGARYEKEFDYSKLVSGNGNLPTLSPGSHQINSDQDPQLVSRAAAIYNFDDNHLVKFMYGEATKGSAEIASGLDAFETREEAKTLEVNYLYSGKNKLFSFSIYNNKNKNLGRFFQTYSAEDGFQTIGSFSGKLNTDGAEVWSRFKPTDDLQLDLSATYSDVSDQDTSETIGNSPKYLYKVKATYLRQPFQYALSARYRDQLYTDWDLINLDGSVNRIGNKVSSNFVIDANMSYTPPSNLYRLNFQIQNLMDETVQYPASENAPFTYGLLGPERSFIFSFHYFLQ